MAILTLPLAGCDRGEPLPPVPPVPPRQQQALPRVDVQGLQQLVAETAAANQILVIDFWATWCVPCVAMFPELHERLHALGDDVRVVSVTLDSPGEYEARAAEFLREHDALDDAYLIDNEHQEEMVETFGERWQDVVVPAILVFDRQGRRTGEFVDVDAHVDAILAEVQRLVHDERVAIQP